MTAVPDGQPDNSERIPQTPGSVVSATLSHNGKTARRVLLRRVTGPGYGDLPWVSEQDVCDRAYWSDSDLWRVRVIFDRSAQ